MIVEKYSPFGIAEFDKIKFPIPPDDLKGDYQNEVTPEGLIATILDKIDGNMFFHYSLARWINSGGDATEFSFAGALDYTFNQKKKFIESLGNLPDDFSNISETFKELLDYQIGFIKNSWESVDTAKRPEAISVQLKNI